LKDQTKAIGFLFLLSITFYLMIDTIYSYALGDYVLEFLKIKAWTGDHLGFHLTIVYFGVPFLILLYFARKYTKVIFGISKWKFFIAFVVCVTCVHWTASSVFISIKCNLEGLNTIGFDNEFNSTNKNKMNYSMTDKVVSSFSTDFQLTNYSNEKREFYIYFDILSADDKEILQLYLYDLDSKPHKFTLQANESMPFNINPNDYMIKPNFTSDYFDGSSSGYLSHLILYDDQGNKVRLDKYDFLGLEQHR
jgi:hypothetical protein